MNIFNVLTKYAEKWQVKSSRKFNEEEIAAVDHAEVVSSQYGNSACFYMKSGGMTFIPMANDATLGIGDSIDLSKANIVTLCKSGEKDIQRISI